MVRRGYRHAVTALPELLDLYDYYGLIPEGLTDWMSGEIEEPLKKALYELFKCSEYVQQEGVAANEVRGFMVQWVVDFFLASQGEENEAYQGYWDDIEYEAQFKIWLQRNYPERIPFEEWLCGVPSGSSAYVRYVI